MTAPAPSAPATPTTTVIGTGFRWWVAGSIVSIAGDAAFNVALSWQATAYGAEAASVVLALPGLVGAAFLLIAGWATDRLSPRRLLVWSSAAFAVSAAAMTLMAFLGRLELAWIAVFAVVIGLRTAVFSPASVALTRQLVPADRFGSALSVRQLITQVASVLGRPLGGALIALGGLAAAAAALVVAYFVAFVTVLRTRVPDQRPPAPSTASSRSARIGQVFAGVSLVARTPLLRQLVLVTGTAAGVLLPIATLLVAVWARDNGAGAIEVGWIVGLMAAANIVVAMIVSLRRPARRLGAVATLGLGLVAVATLGFATASFAVACIVGALVGVGQGLFATHAAPLVKAVPQEHMGKAQSVITLAQTLAASVGTLVLGALVAWLGIAASSIVWAVLAALVVVCAVASPAFRSSIRD